MSMMKKGLGLILALCLAMCACEMGKTETKSPKEESPEDNLPFARSDSDET